MPSIQRFTRTERALSNHKDARQVASVGDDLRPLSREKIAHGQAHKIVGLGQENARSGKPASSKFLPFGQTQPPATGIACPTMKMLFADARKRPSAALSSRRATRPIGTSASRAANSEESVAAGG